MSSNKNNFKCAVMLTGLTRDWHRSIKEMYEYIVKPLDADVYMHLWKPEQLLKDDGYKDRNYSDLGQQNEESLIAYTKHFFTPTSIVFDDYNSYKHLFANPYISVTPGRRTENTFSMHYKNKVGYNVIKNSGIKYDVIIKYRTELFLDRAFTKEDLIVATFNYLVIPDAPDYRGLNDWVAIASPKIMATYCSMFDHLHEITCTIKMWHPETMLAYYINKNKILVNRIDIKTDIRPR